MRLRSSSNNSSSRDKCNKLMMRRRRVMGNRAILKLKMKTLNEIKSINLFIIKLKILMLSQKIS